VAYQRPNAQVSEGDVGMGKIQVHQFNPVIYPYKLWVIISQGTTIIPDTFYDDHGKEIVDFEPDTCKLEALAMPVKHKQSGHYGVVVLFRNRRNMDMGLVAHEASHAAKYLFDHINANPCPHEPFEYVVGWIAGCIERVKLNKP